MLAADSDRERAAAALREHYVHGRLTLEEVTERTGAVLRARSRAEIRSAFAGLPSFELGSAARRVVRGALLVACTGAWFFFSFTLLCVLALTMLFHGASASTLLGFLVVWLVPTYLLARLWQRGPSPPLRG